jgi:hypothetical protein
MWWAKERQRLMKRCNYSAHRLWEVEGVRMELVVMWHISSTRKNVNQGLPQETRQLSDRSGRRGKRSPSGRILDYGTTYGLFQGKRRRNNVGGKVGNGRDLGFGPCFGLPPFGLRTRSWRASRWSPRFTFYKIPFLIRECGGDTTKELRSTITIANFVVHRW